MNAPAQQDLDAVVGLSGGAGLSGGGEGGGDSGERAIGEAGGWSIAASDLAGRSYETVALARLSGERRWL